MPQHAYYNDPTLLVATKNEETTSILPVSSGAWAGMEARQQPYRRGGRQQREARDSARG
jgi:hypothetical protein